MKITSTMALAAIAATCSVPIVNASTNDASLHSINDGMHQHFKESGIKMAVSNHLHDITQNMLVDGVNLHEVYANTVQSRGNTQASGATYDQMQTSWCHQKYSKYSKYDKHSKHHHWKSGW